MLGLSSSLSSGAAALKSIVKSGLQLFYKANRTQAPPNSIKDHSRNSNDGTLYSGKALNFDGAGDSVTVGDTGIDMKTVAFWIFVADVTSNTEQIMEFKTDHGISSLNGTITTDGTFTNKVTYVNGSVGSSISASTWSRIVITTTAAIDVNQLVFGTDGSSSGTFVIADFQLYDKTWTASDVEFDYNNPDKDVFDNSNSSIVVTDCKSLLRLNEGAGDRVYDAAPVLGAEEVVNGSIDSISNWHLGDGWSYVDGKASLVQVGDPQSGDYLEQEITGLVNGKTYIISFDLNIISATTATIGVSNNGVFGQIHQNNRFFTTSGRKTITAIYDSSHASGIKNLRFVGGSNTAFTIDNVSVKEIKPPESFAIVGDKTFVNQQPSIPQYAMSSFSKKMVFDGSNDYVDCASDASIDNIFTGGGTFSAWISPKTDGGDSLGTIISKGTVSIRVKDDDNDGVILSLTKEFSTINADFLTSDEVVLENKMNHIAITYNDSDPNNNPSFYVNGAFKATDDTNSTTPVGSASTDASSNLIIGNVSAGGPRSFDGIIDEVSLFKTELTRDEVSELYNSGSSFDSKGHSKYNLDEKVLDGDFSSSDNWTLQPAWSISNNKALYDDSDEENIQQALSVSAGKTYQLSFDISDCPTSARIQIYFGKEGTSVLPETSRENGSYVVTFKPSIDDENLTFKGFFGGDIFSLSNVSLKEISLIAYWRNNGADTWTDLSTNTNHGTVSGSPTEIFLQEVPFFGKDSLGMFMNKPRLGGLNFNKSGYVEIGNTFQSTFRDSFSICFWFKFPDGQPSPPVRFLGHDAGNNDLFISLEADGKSKFQFQSSADRVISITDAPIASNNQTDWIYLTVTLTKALIIGDAQIIFYKDGSAVDSSLVGTDTLTQSNMELYTQDQNLVLGAFNNEGTIDTDTCDGIIDDFKIYSKALTAAEISKNYNATKGRHKN